MPLKTMSAASTNPIARRGRSSTGRGGAEGADLLDVRGLMYYFDASDLPGLRTEDSRS
jgi:hypothetical protein